MNRTNRAARARAKVKAANRMRNWSKLKTTVARRIAELRVLKAKIGLIG